MRIGDKPGVGVWVDVWVDVCVGMNVDVRVLRAPAVAALAGARAPSRRR